MAGRMVEGLFVGETNSTRAEYVRVLGLDEDAGWGDIAREQSRRYFAKKERDTHRKN